MSGKTVFLPPVVLRLKDPEAERVRLSHNEKIRELQLHAAGGSSSSPSSSSIGGATGGTPGSVLFVDASGELAQDNGNLFWDAANKALGIGTNNPGEGYGVAADISLGIRRVGANFVLIDNVTTAADAGIYIQTAATNRDACIFVDETDAQKLKFATGTFNNHASRVSQTWMYIDQSGNVQVTGTLTSENIVVSDNLTVQTMPVGGVVFAAAGGQLTTDTTHFAWDATNHALTVGAGSGDNSPLSVVNNTQGTGSSTMLVQHGRADGYATIVFNDSGAVQQCAFGYANVSAPATRVAGHSYVYAPNADFMFTNSTQNQATLGMLTGAAFLELADGASAAVSAASCARLRWNNGTGKLQISKSGAAYVDII